VPDAVAADLGDRGFTLVVFGEDEGAWDAPFASLAEALGR
jgi:hypothetical protein